MKVKYNCEYADQITCPYCGYEHEDCWENESCEFNCSHCREKFYLEVETTTTFTSTCGDEDHDFVDQPTKEHPDYQLCSRCEECNFKKYD